MIRERESIMFESTFQSKELFPNFLILCKPNSEDSKSDSGNMENEWNGVIKEIEKLVKRHIEASSQHQKKTTSAMSGDINNRMSEMEKKMEKRMEEMNNRMEELTNLLKNKLIV